MQGRSVALAFCFCLALAPSSYALNIHGPGVLANSLALSIFDLSAASSPQDAPSTGNPPGGPGSGADDWDPSFGEGFPDFGTDMPSTPGFSDAISSVPEPTSIVLIGTGLVGVAAVTRRRRRCNPRRT